MFSCMISFDANFTVFSLTFSFDITSGERNEAPLTMLYFNRLFSGNV